MNPIEVLVGILLLLLTGLFTYLWLSLRRAVIILPAVLALILALVVFLSFRFVPPGHRGVFTWMGAVEDRVAGEGLVILVPGVESLHLVDVRVTPHDFKKIEAASKELLGIIMTGKLNFHIEPAKTNVLYQQVGLDFAEKVLDSALSDFIKEVTPDYPINEILPKRDEIRRRVVEKLGANLARYGILIDDLYIADISFTPEFSAAIERERVAEKNVLTEKQLLESKKIQADQANVEAEGKSRAAVRTAEGASQAILINARAQADANALLAKSLTREVIDFALVQKLGEKVEVIVLPAGTGIFASLTDLIPKK